MTPSIEFKITSADFAEYSFYLRKLAQNRRSNFLSEESEDSILDKMDSLWSRLNKSERKMLDYISEILIKDNQLKNKTRVNSKRYSDLYFSIVNGEIRSVPQKAFIHFGPETNFFVDITSTKVTGKVLEPLRKVVVATNTSNSNVIFRRR